MDNATRHNRIAQRFLISLMQQYGLAAPVILRRWADELEALAEEESVSEESSGHEQDWRRLT